MTFLRSVAVLVSGTALGHGLTAAALPVLSRLYTPADFSLLAVFNGLVSVLSVAICFRFDVAIALPEKDAEALSLLALATGIAVALAAVLWALLLIDPQWVSSVLNQPNLSELLWLVPLSALLAGICSSLQMWFVRKKNFPLIAKSRIAQSATGAGTQILYGSLLLGGAGLLIGQLVNLAVATLWLGQRMVRDVKVSEVREATSWSRIATTFRSYQRFPKYSTFEALCNSASIQLPLLIIAAMAAQQEAGHLLMATYVMQAPMALIGAAVGQVFLSRAVDEHRKGRLDVYTAEVLAGLLKTGVGPLLVVGILAPVAFEPVFGAGWERSGTLVAWMTPWFITQFLASPVSMALHITGHQRTAFLLQLCGLLIRVAAVWLTGMYATEYLSEIYALSGLIFYSIYLGAVVLCVGIPVRKLIGILQPCIKPTLLYTVSAILLAVAAKELLTAA